MKSCGSKRRKLAHNVGQTTSLDSIGPKRVKLQQHEEEDDDMLMGIESHPEKLNDEESCLIQKVESQTQNE